MEKQADYFLASVLDAERERDSYVAGELTLDEAFDKGFLDPKGVEGEGIQEAWDRSYIGNRDCTDRQIELWKARFDALIARDKLNQASVQELNAEAIENLKKEYPTCNICRNSMQPRFGKFGKFYYCDCGGQGTVSDRYWQSVKT